MAAGDDRSDLKLSMDVGTYPAGSDVLNQEELGGESTVMMKVLVQTFFSVFGVENANENRG